MIILTATFSLLFILLLVFIKRRNSISIFLYPGFIFYFYSVFYILLGSIAISLPIDPVTGRYLRDFYLDLDLLSLYSLLFGSILLIWLSSTKVIPSYRISKTKNTPQYFSYLLLPLLFFTPAIIRETLGYCISTISSVALFDTKFRIRTFFSSISRTLYCLLPIAINAFANSTSKRVVFFPIMVAALFVYVKNTCSTNPRGAAYLNSFRIVLSIKKYAQPILIFILFLAIFLLFLPFVQSLRCSACDTDLAYYFVTPNLLKLSEISSLFVHSLNLWHLVQSSSIDQTIFHPMFKLLGLGRIPFSGDRLSSTNDIYTGFIEPLYRSIGGSHPPLKWVSSFSLYYFPFSFIFSFLNLLLLTFLFRISTRLYNFSSVYIIFGVFTAVHARGADISLVVFEIFSSLFVFISIHYCIPIFTKIFPARTATLHL